jgi:Ca-activated chloride channel family protein
MAAGAWAVRPSAEQARPRPALTVQITSPLGRTGVSGPVRIVARIVAADGKTPLSPVQFYVDGDLVGEDTDGPPYAVEWKDENPFVRREILVQVADADGHSAEDRVVLAPLEFSENARVASVLLEPAVFDANGRPVNGLGIGDFQVAENGVPQTIELATPDTVPATYTLLVDSSQSMARRMDFVRDAARQLPEHLRPNDQVMVVPFSRTIGAITGPTQDRETIGGAIDAIQSSGGTAILDCLTKVAGDLSASEGRQIIVLLTDGYDENSRISFDSALASIKAAKATVYVIAISGVAGISIKGEDLLRRIATETGGRAFFPSREAQLADVHAVIADDVQQRYVVTYTPTNQRLDGSWRQILLTTTNPAHTIRVRSGYYAPAPPPIRPQIELTIRDRNREIIDITPDDLQVFEDGIEQRVDAFEEALTPVSIVLALDSSGSMRKDAAAVMDAARTFVKALPSQDKLAVMTFDDRPDLAHDLTTNRDWSLEAIDRYRAAGGTALYDAIFDGLARLKRADGRTAMVVLTDGRDENNPGTAPGSTHTLADVLSNLSSVGATVYAIGLGPNVDRVTLEQVAEASTGDAYFPSDVSTLAAEYRRILENLRRRYILSYTSTNTSRDGAWRKVEIRSVRPGVVIQTRGGYFAPEAN